MPDLREQLQHCFEGRVCLLGLGNVDHGDDGFGVRLAQELSPEIRTPKAEARNGDVGRGASEFGFRPSFGLRTSAFGLTGPARAVIMAGTSPERFLGQIADVGFEAVIFLDAVDFGGAPGSVVFLHSDEMAARFPQVSTHKLSLGLLARQIEANGRTKAWLLGVQPESLKPGAPLSPALQATRGLLLELLSEVSREVMA